MNGGLAEERRHPIPSSKEKEDGWLFGEIIQSVQDVCACLNTQTSCMWSGNYLYACHSRGKPKRDIHALVYKPEVNNVCPFGITVGLCLLYQYTNNTRMSHRPVMHWVCGCAGIYAHLNQNLHLFLYMHFEGKGIDPWQKNGNST